MDHIWAAGETVRSHLNGIEMSLFQEALIKRGVQEHLEEEDAMTPSVQFPIMYAAVLAAECFEEINKVSKQVVNQDLVVGGRRNKSPTCSLIHFQRWDERLERMKIDERVKKDC